MSFFVTSDAVVTIYGLQSCDSCRKARRWLEDHGHPYRFHDVRAQGLEENTLSDWLDELGWETLVNRRSTSWRSLAQSERVGLDERQAAALLLRHPTLMKRPVVVLGNRILVGFDPERLATMVAD